MKKKKKEENEHKGSHDSLESPDFVKKRIKKNK
jgi:hypothetical protein